MPNGSNNRASNQNVAHAGSRSSKNAIGMSNLSSFNTGPTPQAPSNNLGSNLGNSSHKNNSSSSKRKTSKKLANQPAYNTATVGQQPMVQQSSTVNPSSLTGDQLLYMMQNKRDKFNNSALLQGQRSGFDEFNQSLAAQISGQIRPDSKNASQITNIVNLNKLYQQRRTPTSQMAGQS